MPFLALVLVGCHGASTHPAAPTSAAPAVSASPPSLAEVVARSTPSIVVVRTPTRLGSGYAAGNGVIVTNLHVVEGADRILVEQGAHAVDVTYVLAADPLHDLALLQIAQPLPPLPAGDDSRLRVGDPVTAIGAPEGLELTVSTGIVSSIRLVSPTLTLLQVTAPISPGSSGGPLLDAEGRVVGVTALVAQGQNLNFAIPAHYVAMLLSERRVQVRPVDFARVRFGARQHPEPKRVTGPPRNPHKFPTTIAGFELGSTLDQTREACPGHFRQGNNYAECNTPPVDVPFGSGKVRLYYLKNRLIAVAFGVTSLAEARMALVSKYGEPRQPEQQGFSWPLDGGDIRVSDGSKNRPEVTYTSAPWDTERNY